jgi:pimeloyl-ACP methyl ester carboxylesterase
MSTVTAKDGTVIDYQRYGDGPAVVFIGGATQYRAVDQNTTRLAELVGAAGFAAIDYDRRGRGASTDTAPWALEREVEDVAALIAANGGTATLCSSSSGGAVALAAATAGIGVEALALYEPPFFAGNSHTEHLAELRRLIAAGDHDGAMRYNLREVIGLPPEGINGFAASPGWAGVIAAAPTLVYDLTAVDAVNTDPDWPGRWAEVAVPVIVYSGSETFPGMPAVADAVAAALPGAGRRVVDGQGHAPAAEAYAPVLLEFLRR